MIAYQASGNTRATIDIVDVAGRRVRSVQDEEVSAGSHKVSWDGRDQSGLAVPSGVYFARIRVGTLEATREIVVGR